MDQWGASAGCSRWDLFWSLDQSASRINARWTNEELLLAVQGEIFFDHWTNQLLGLMHDGPMRSFCWLFKVRSFLISNLPFRQSCESASLWCGSGSWFLFDADADPDPTFHFDADPAFLCGSGSGPSGNLIDFSKYLTKIYFLTRKGLCGSGSAFPFDPYFYSMQTRIRLVTLMRMRVRIQVQVPKMMRIRILNTAFRKMYGTVVLD